MQTYERELAECVGLWLAEGDTKTNREITFTNNCFELIMIFYKNMKKLFPCKNYRLYVYIPARNSKYEKIEEIKENVYIDKRASKPYYIIRAASKKMVTEWRKNVKSIKNSQNLYSHILRGFFAGEGNLKTGSHNNRQIRISQKKPNKLVEKILNFYEINFKFSSRERAYVISDRVNWDKLAKIRIANLHPIKKDTFWSIYSEFKEYHYPLNKIKKTILNFLDEPCTTKDLAKKYNRSQSRIQRILTRLKRSGKVKCFRVRSNTFWLNNYQNIILVSGVKYGYLSLLQNNINSTNILAKKLGVCPKSSYRRLKEMEKLGIVRRNFDKKWELIDTNKKVIAI